MNQQPSAVGLLRWQQLGAYAKRRHTKLLIAEPRPGFFRANSHPVSRRCLPGARDDRLFFAQVREDPLLEIEGLGALAGKRVAIISSGGCTALSLIAAGAAHVTSIDLNRTQNHLVELKCAAAASLSAQEACAFLGGAVAQTSWRQGIYAVLRESLSAHARAYWDAHRRAIAQGIIGCGVSERLIKLICVAVRTLVHSRKKCAQLLALRSLEEQVTFYRKVWDTGRWRLLFPLLCSRFVFNTVYDRTFFRHLRQSSFSRHFRKSAEHGLTTVPIRSNYFLHQMLTGFYPIGVENGVPPYLSPDASAEMGFAPRRLELIDGSFADHLKTCPDSSIDGFSLSNICEWMTPQQIDALFSEILRTAVPGARLCFRNFVGWTEIPKRFRGTIVEDHKASEGLSRRDRALMQRRFVVCRIDKTCVPPHTRRILSLPSVRDALPKDNAELLALSALCPMNGAIGMYIDRSPDFFALNPIEGSFAQVGVTQDSQGRIRGCISAAARETYLDGEASTTMYAGNLKVSPGHRNRLTADALSEYARDFCRRQGGSDVPILSTILAGNTAMEYRARGQRGMPRLRRFATLRSYAISVLWPRGAPNWDGYKIAPAVPSDLQEMAELWQRVATLRQFAPVYTAASLAHWIDQAPALSLSDYSVARGRDGRIKGFFALWDQSSFQKARVTRYSSKLRAIRTVFNAGAPLFGAMPLPEVGDALSYLTVTHLCVPADEPAVLRALLVSAYNGARRGTHSFIAIGLDVRDPLSEALRGLIKVPTDFGAYVWSPGGRYAGPALDKFPLHLEIALA